MTREETKDHTGIGHDDFSMSYFNKDAFDEHIDEIYNHQDKIITAITRAGFKLVDVDGGYILAKI